MKKVAEKQVKDLLLIEAQKKHDFGRNIKINEILFHDAEDHVNEFIKEGMAMAGHSNLAGSWNTAWSESNRNKSDQAGALSNSIIHEMSQVFSGLAQNPVQKLVIKSGVDQFGSIQFNFEYKRSIMPINHPESFEKADNAINVLDKWFASQGMPGLREFMQALEDSSINLSPFFNTGEFSSASGGLGRGDAANFIQGEVESGKQYYPVQDDQMKRGVKIQQSKLPSTKIVDRDDLNSVRFDSQLMDAIKNRSADYELDKRALQEEFSQMSQGLSGNVAEQQKSYRSILQNYAAVSKGQSIPRVLENRRLKARNLKTDDLRLMLKHMTVPKPGTDAGSVNKFSIPTTIVRKNNGFDDYPGMPGETMPMVPPLRKTIGGEVMYDRDSGNLGGGHLRRSWKNEMGGLNQILTNFGEVCKGWFSVLRNAANVEGFPEEITDAIRAVFWSRTSAENVIEMLKKYPNWQSYYDEHISKSLSSELISAASLAKMKNSALSLDEMRNYDLSNSNTVDKLSAQVIKKYLSGQITWDRATRYLHQLTKQLAEKPGKNRVFGFPDKGTSLDQEGFEQLIQYGYPVAKMMDFLSALMTKSCKEVIQDPVTGKEHILHGRFLSASSGAGKGGKAQLRGVNLFVEYEYDIEYNQSDMVNIKEQTHFYADPTVQVGQAGSVSGEAKPVSSEGSWREAMNMLQSRWPTILDPQEIGFLYEPVLNNLNTLETHVTAAISEAQKISELTASINYTSQEGNTVTIQGQAPRPPSEEVSQSDATLDNTNAPVTPETTPMQPDGEPPVDMPQTPPTPILPEKKNITVVEP